jgi:hypothetical protein
MSDICIFFFVTKTFLNITNGQIKMAYLQSPDTSQLTIIQRNFDIHSLYEIGTDDTLRSLMALCQCKDNESIADLTISNSNRIKLTNIASSEKTRSFNELGVHIKFMEELNVNIRNKKAMIDCISNYLLNQQQYKDGVLYELFVIAQLDITIPRQYEGIYTSLVFTTVNGNLFNWYRTRREVTINNHYIGSMFIFN